MENTAPNKPIRLLIAKDGSSADLVIPEQVAEDELSYEACLHLLHESSIVVTSTVSERLRAVIESYTPGTELRETVAKGVPVVHGEDGRIEWEPGLEPETETSDEADADQSDSGEAGSSVPKAPEGVCFYSRSIFVMVEAGQKLGRLLQPTDGTDGNDVRGQNIAAKAGKPLKVRFEESVAVSNDGLMTAQVDGVLSRSRDKIAVRQYLEIAGYVDFSTGNIDFDGDIKILKGVRDLFEVSATGNIEISSLIESATVIAKGDIAASGGMAGRERGILTAGGDTTIRYIDSTQVNVGGVLRFEREMINCQAMVTGSIESPAGSIIGGETTVVGKVLVSVLGSSSNVSTTLNLGSVPSLESKLASLEKLVEALEAKCVKMDRELKNLLMPGRILSNQDRERQTELSFELHNVKSQRAKCEASLRDLTARIQAIRTVDVSIEKMLYAGVRLAIGNQIFRINKDIKGPMRILLDRKGEIVYRVGDHGTNMPIRQISEIRAAAA
ncbi:MAG: FapA family protein [Phycisphaerales bacterium]